MLKTRREAVAEKQRSTIVSTNDDETIRDRLDYLRGEIEAERISYGEIAELQGLAEHIDPGDTVLRQWAGIPETEEQKTLGQKARDWDEAVEDGVIDDEAAPRKPFDAGLVLAAAELLDAYGAIIRDEDPRDPKRFAAAMSGLRETVEEIIA